MAITGVAGVISKSRPTSSRKTPPNPSRKQSAIPNSVSATSTLRMSNGDIKNGDASGYLSDTLSESAQPKISKYQYKPPTVLPPWNLSTKSQEQSDEKAESQYVTSPFRESIIKSQTTRKSKGAKIQQQRKKLGGLAKSEPFLNRKLGDTSETLYEVVGQHGLSTTESYFYHEDHNPSHYKATPLQCEVFNKLCPSKEELESASFVPYKGPSLVLSQGYKIYNHTIQISDFVKCFNRVLSVYSVARTRFYRNERIIDADVECMMDERQWNEIPDNAYVQYIDASKHALLHAATDSAIKRFTCAWLEDINVRQPFSVLLIQHPVTDNNHHPICHMVFGVSVGILDQLSLTWIAYDVIMMYRECYRLRKFGKSDPEIAKYIGTHGSIEEETFAEFANECQGSKTDTSFWRKQCIETTQESVEVTEKDDIEGQLKRLEKQKVVLQTSVSALDVRVVEIEKELTQLKEQRLQIERSENGEGTTSTYIDAITGEQILITTEAKKALIKSVLGEEAATGDIKALLNKHEVSEEVQVKINARNLTLETFAGITEVSIEHLNLMTRDRRKILALAEYVRNRIKDCLHEQAKVKFSLERKIAKLSREFESAADSLKTTRNKLESNDDLTIRLNYILKPPYLDTKILPVSIVNQHQDNDIYGSGSSLSSLPRESSTVSLDDRYGYIALNIGEETFDNLRGFRNNWSLSLKSRSKNRKPHEIDISDNESLLGSDDDDEQDGVESNEHLNFGGANIMDRSASTGGLFTNAGHKRVKHKSVEEVCLAALAILVKHISGSSKYLLGVSQSYRRHGLCIGPLTDTMPIKIDMTSKDQTFDGLFSAIMKVYQDSRRHGVAFTKTQIESILKSSCDLKVIFSFMNYREVREWVSRGLKIDDLLEQPGESFKTVGMNVERMWTTSQQDSFDIKLRLVETQDGLFGGIIYRQNVFDENKIKKWASKYQSILECVDYGPKKIPISSIISRFYHQVWQGSDSNLSKSSMSLYDSISSGLNKA